MKPNVGIAFAALAWAVTFGAGGCKSQLAEGADTHKAKGGRACTAADVKLAIYPTNHKFPTQMDACASDSWGNAKKTTKCLKTHYAAMSDACANCFGEMASCSASNCKWKCIGDHFSDGCLACVNSNCRDSHKDDSFNLSACTGLKPSELPPSK